MPLYPGMGNTVTPSAVQSQPADQPDAAMEESMPPPPVDAQETESNNEDV